MNIVLTRSNVYLFLIGLVLFFVTILTRLPAFQLQPTEFSLAITLDLLVTIPLLYYLAIKDREIPKITVASAAIIGLLLATLIIPREHQASLDTIKVFAIPCLELGILGFVFFKARTIYQTIQSKQGQVKIDFYDLAVVSCCEVLPKRFGRALATEIGVFYYAFFPLSTSFIQKDSFTYHSKNKIRSTIGALLFVILIEAVTIHLIVHPGAPKVAWALAFLSIYTALQVLALIRSIPKRPILIDSKNNVLILRYGFICEAIIPFSNIESIELHTRSLPDKSHIVQFSPLGILDSHNLIVHLKEEDTFHRMYGLRKRYSSLAVYVDQKENFKEALNSILA